MTPSVSRLRSPSGRDHVPVRARSRPRHGAITSTSWRDHDSASGRDLVPVRTRSRPCIRARSRPRQGAITSPSERDHVPVRVRSRPCLRARSRPCLRARSRLRQGAVTSPSWRDHVHVMARSRLSIRRDHVPVRARSRPRQGAITSLHQVPAITSLHRRSTVPLALSERYDSDCREPSESSSPYPPTRLGFLDTISGHYRPCAARVHTSRNCAIRTSASSRSASDSHGLETSSPCSFSRGISSSVTEAESARPLIRRIFCSWLRVQQP